MKLSHLTVAGPALVLLLAAGPAHAALHDRGAGLVYDDALNVTWLQDADLATTETFGVASGIHGDGTMSGVAAGQWIAGMNAAAYKGYSDWRLPTVAPVNGSSFQLIFRNDGSTDVGANIGSPASELAYLFYVELGNLSIVMPDGTVRSGTLGVDYGLVNPGPFIDLAGWSGAYSDFLTGTPVPGIPMAAFTFSIASGVQSYGGLAYDSYHAWALRDGDVLAVPEPQSTALIGGGLLLVGAALRRRRAPTV